MASTGTNCPATKCRQLCRAKARSRPAAAPWRYARTEAFISELEWGPPASSALTIMDDPGKWRPHRFRLVPSSGIFSIACEGRGDALVATGGDYNRPADSKQVAIHSEDGGETWQLAETQPGGYRSAVGSCAYDDFAAVGPNGTDEIGRASCRERGESVGFAGG